jgi:hypothetical protein
MPRLYSEQFLLKLARTNSTKLGIRLGKICVEANLPTTYVAKALNVSRKSVQRWIRGSNIRMKEDQEYIKAFISMVEGGLANGFLPALTLSDAKQYLKLDE